MKHEILNISFEFPDAYTKKKRFYTGKVTLQDTDKGVYLAFDFLDEYKNPPLNFSSMIYLHTVKLKTDVSVWVSSDRQHQKELLQTVGEAIEIAGI
jgi:hypothetical protein